MCNDYEQHIAWDAYVKAMQGAALTVPARQSGLDLPPADDVRIGDVAPVVRLAERGDLPPGPERRPPSPPPALPSAAPRSAFDASPLASRSHPPLPQAGEVASPAPLVSLTPMRFGFPPEKAGRSPVFNFRSEGRSFAGSRRCLIPASAFFEFTGARYPKAKHRFALKDAPFLCVAGLWKPGEGNQPDAFTMLTTAPGPDVAPYHGRQVAVLGPEDWRAWLELARPEAELLRPLPAGTLAVRTVRGAATSCA